MRIKAVLFLLATFAISGFRVSAADRPAAKVEVSRESAKVELARFGEAQITYVQSWIRQKAPECPPDAASSAAEAFLQELQDRQPQKFDQLLSPDFPVGAFDSMLLRHVGAQLKSPAHAPLREQVARRRIQTVLAGESGAVVTFPAAVDPLLAKIKDLSPAQYRRLLEGRIEDDDLTVLLRKARQNETTAGNQAGKPTVPAKPKVLTASDIVSEFARRNQEGSALQRLRAYTIEGRLKTAAGEEQQVLLFRMRPDRFRLVVLSGGVTRVMIGFDGQRHWQQLPGQAPMALKADMIGSRRYLGEFVDPLFAEDRGGFTYERLEDGAAGDQKFYRIQVRRTDGSSYVARVAPDSFHEVGRESDDKSTTSYADFREIGGVTIAFHEDVTEANGAKGTFDIVRASPNPGLVEAFFEPSSLREPDYFSLERAMARAPSPTANK